MDHSTALTVLEVGAILLMAAAAGWLARRASLPAIVGYLAVGIAISPFTPGYVADGSQVSLFAEVGAILLLFEVGIEVDLRELRREHPAVLWAAPLQMAITFIAALVAFVALGLALEAAALLGVAIAMSSSVVVVNITRSRRRTTDKGTEHLLIGWSVLQDVVGVAAAIILLSAVGAGQPIEITILGLIAFALLSLVSAYLLPRILTKLRSEPDLFLAVAIATGLAVAGVGAVLAGIPLALAAFVAGLTISEGPVAAEARKRLLPFRDLFAIFFFVAIGMLIDPAALFAQRPGLARPVPRTRPVRQDPGDLRAGQGVAAARACGPARPRARADRRVRVRPRHRRRRPRRPPLGGLRGAAGRRGRLDRRLVDPCQAHPPPARGSARLRLPAQAGRHDTTPSSRRGSCSPVHPSGRSPDRRIPQSSRRTMRRSSPPAVMIPQPLAAGLFGVGHSPTESGLCVKLPVK